MTQYTSEYQNPYHGRHTPRRARAIAVSQQSALADRVRLAAIGLVGLVALLIATFGMARADDRVQVPAATAEQMQSIISAQIDAFLAEDADAAYAFAAEVIKMRFQSPSQFVAMVQQGYPAVYAPQSYAFADAAMTPQGLAQQVEFVGEDGQVWRGIYTFDEADSGELLISGVFLRRQNERQI